MGCILSFIGSIVSKILYFFEKFMYCFTCAVLVSCLVTTLFVTLGLGIGIGYNYCFVDFKTKHRIVPTKYNNYYRPSRPTPAWRKLGLVNVTASGVTENENNLRTANSSNEIPIGNENKAKFHNNINNTKLFHHILNFGTMKHMHENKNQVTQTDQERSTEKTTEDSPNLIIPISGLDLIALLSKFRSENRNYSLQIVTS